MNPSEYQEEWLSAYLDDELTEEQRQIVEARLAIDTAARSTLEDLKRVRKLVSELSPWSGEDLRAKMDSIVNRRTDGELDEDGLDDGELDAELRPNLKSALQHSFDEVPQSLNGDEVRSEAMVGSDWNRNPSRRFPITWLASAASILLALGLGAAVWYGSGSGFPGLALNDSAKTSAPAGAVAAPQSIESDGMFRQGANAEGANAEVANGYVFDATAPESSGKAPADSPLAPPDERGLKFGVDAPSAMQKTLRSEAQDPQNAPVEDSLAADPKAVDSLAANLPSRSNFQPAAPGQATRSAADESALGRVAPAMPTSPLPAPASAFAAPAPAANALALAPPEPAPAAMWAADSVAMARLDERQLDGVAAAPKEPPASRATTQDTRQPVIQTPVVQIARSSVWSDSEIEAALSGTLNSLGMNSKIAQSGDKSSAGQHQSATEVVAPAVMLAAIDPATTVDADFFAELVGENQLATLELVTVPEQPATELATKEQTADREMAKLDSAPQAKQFEAREGATAPASQSIVLFLTQAEAEGVLEKLKQSGVVKPQVWRVAMAPQEEAGAAQATPPANDAEPLRTAGAAGGIAAEQSPSKKGAATGKVILLLSTPPR